MIDNVLFSSEDLRQYFVIPIIITCFILGYVIKHYTKFPNRYIPIVMMSLGIGMNIVFAIVHTSTMTFITILGGAISGLASCGFYDMITAKMGLTKNKKEAKIKEKEETEDEPEA